MEDDLFDGETILDKATRLQNGLIARSTGGAFDGDDEEYKKLRHFFWSRSDTKTKLPDFVRRCRDLSQFWAFARGASDTYAGRRSFIWDGFRPLLEYLEADDHAPGTAPISETVKAFDAEHVHAAWQKALDRRVSDPEGAITAARTLIESVCKHILDDENVDYPNDADLPKLWGLVAELLHLAPGQHDETVFKAILGNCQAVVNNIAAIRNRVGDAHGQGRRPIRPKPRHAELAVNLERWLHF